VLPITLSPPTYTKDARSMLALSASAVRGKDELVHVGLSNLDPNRASTATVSLADLTALDVRGRVLTAPAMNALNSFDAPQTVVPVAFTGAGLEYGLLTVTLPAKSVVMLELK
jgi:alpha-N-arabinofuranosidase